MRPALPIQRAPFTPCGGPRTPARRAREQRGPFQRRDSNRVAAASPTSSASTSSASTSSASPSSSSSFTVDLKVRDSELDQFLVVNNANYAVYLQHARHEFLERIGLPVAAATQEGGALALSRLVLDFKAPLRSGDVARVGVRVTSARGARVEMEQWVDAVRRGAGEAGGGGGGESEEAAAGVVAVRALDAEATVVALDGRYRPRRLPGAVRRALETGERVPEGTRWFSSPSESESDSGSGSDLD